jgi:hypothetical protein
LEGAAGGRGGERPRKLSLSLPLRKLVWNQAEKPSTPSLMDCVALSYPHVIAGEVERRLELNQAAERQRMELEQIKAGLAPGREVGTIKKWFYDKQYGFFECSEMADVFVHVKDVKPEHRKHCEKRRYFRSSGS